MPETPNHESAEDRSLSEAPAPPASVPVLRRGRARHLTLVAVAAAHVLAVWFTMDGVGMAWDEGFYFEPNRGSMVWLADWIRGDLPEGHDAYWGQTPEYLAVPRVVHGLSGWLFEDHWLVRDHFLPALVAQRLLNGVAHGLSVWLIGLLLLGPWGLGPALVGMLAFGSVPSLFGYAHFATAETLTITMTLLVTVAFLRGLRSVHGAILVGILFGLALNTKFNAVLLPIVLWLWAWWHHRRAMTNNLMAMIFIGPLVWVLTWPWVWSDTVPRLLTHCEHFLGHIQTSTFFHGVRWGWDASPTPWHYPLEMAAVTTPIPTLVLGLLGLHTCLRDGGPQGRARLFALLCLVPLGVACLPGTPRYDGVRLFLPAFAGFALVIGVVYARLLDLLVRHRPLMFGSRGGMLALHALAIAAVTLPGQWGIFRIHPHELSWYNSLVGGLRGAANGGYETTLWCESLNEPVVDHINQTLPEGAHVRLGDDFSPLVIEHLQRWGVLRSDLVFGRNPLQTADFALIQGRQGMFRARDWFLWERWRPTHFRDFGWPRWSEVPEVPLIMVAQTGPAFEAALEGYLIEELGEEGYRAYIEAARALQEAQRSGP
jgi:hypothetical protein